METGKIQIYTGDGKGKTTAALGLAIRAIGRNKKVVIVYFDKGGNHYGERIILDKLKSNFFNYYVTGLERFELKTKQFRFGVTSEDIKEAKRGLKLVATEFQKNQIDLLILDEINTTIKQGMIKVEDFLIILGLKPKNMELVLTGRDADPKIIEKADLVTEMKMIKHYYNQGLNAREGIEY